MNGPFKGNQPTRSKGRLCNHESICYCSGDVCLVGGDSQSGNVFVRGRPVCDDAWSMTDAHVVCRELGYREAKNATTRSL